MSTTGPENPAAAGQPSGHGAAGSAEPDAPGTAGGSPAAAGLAVARTPFTGRAWRELLFCAIEVPLGLCALVFPIALLGLPSAVALLSYGGLPPARPGPAHPGGLLSALGGVAIVVLLALLFLAPRIGRGLGAAHRRLAARLLGERI